MPVTPVKSFQTDLLAWQDVAAAAHVISSAFNCADLWAAAIAVRLGRRTGTAFTAGSPNVLVQASFRTSGNNSWIDIDTFQPLVGATIVNTTLSSAITANDATFTVTSATNIAVNDLLFLGHSSAANYEIVKVKSISGTTITPYENVVNAHTNAALVTDQAEQLIHAYDLSVFRRIRAIIDNLGSGQNISAEVALMTFDSF